MIDIKDVTERMILKIKSLTTIEQVIDHEALETFTEKELKTPRIIVRRTRIKGSEYHYEDTYYNPQTATMNLYQNRIETLHYDIDFITNMHDFNFIAHAELNKVRDHFNFQDGTDKLDGIESVTRYTSNILEFKFARFQIPETVYRLSVLLDINNIAEKEVGYADKFGVELKIKE
jgi:hypothetical protein